MKSIFISVVALTLFSELGAMQVQGHRGSRATMPENTIPSFEAAIQAGVDVLEMDLLLTSDQEWVIHHNFFINLDLCTYLDGSLIESSSLIRDLTLFEVKQIDAGGKVNPKFPKQAFVPSTTIPTLKELFAWIQNSSHPSAKTVRLNLEIKRDPRFPERTQSPKVLAEKIVNLVEESGFADRVYYSSFDPEVLIELRRKNPTVTLAFIFEEESLEVISPSDFKKAVEIILQIASSYNIEILSPNHEFLEDLVNVKALQERGFKVVPWTVNDPKRWDELKAKNVDGIITDDPEAFALWNSTSLKHSFLESRSLQ